MDDSRTPASPPDDSSSGDPEPTAPPPGPRPVAGGSWIRVTLPTAGNPRLRPYLQATGLAAAVLAVLVVVGGFPPAATFQLGLTYLAVALVARRLEDLPPEVGSRPVRWGAERLRRLEDDFGVEFYGLASLTAFLRAQVLSLSETEISLSGLLDDPIVSLVTWLIAELIESVFNVLWATLWWLQLLRAVPGIGWFVAVVAAGWAVWRLLDVEPRGETARAAAEGPGPAVLPGEGPPTDRPAEPGGSEGEG